MFLRTLLAIFWMGLGIINGVLLSNRVTPFTGPDLHLITDAFNIMNKYLSPGLMVVALIGILLALAGLALLFFKGPRYQGTLKYCLLYTSQWGDPNASRKLEAKCNAGSLDIEFELD